jgi:predicted TPR repeat methyltransferase
VHNTQDQDRQWSRHAARYDELFLDALDPAVENPLWSALDAVPNPESLTVADLGCGTGPL